MEEALIYAGLFCFRSLWLKRRQALSKLQQVMGHSSLQVSLTYLRGLEVKQLDAEDMPILWLWNSCNMMQLYSWFLLGLFFRASSFNQDISNWNVSNVITMNGMFTIATSFNQDLSQWCVSNISSLPSDFSTNSALTAANHPVWGTCP